MQILGHSIYIEESSGNLQKIHDILDAVNDNIKKTAKATHKICD